MVEEWATLPTNVHYGRRRSGWLLGHHLRDRPGKISDGQRCALASDRTLKKHPVFVKCTLKVNLLSVKVVVLLKVVDLVRFVGGIIRGGFRLLG